MKPKAFIFWIIGLSGLIGLGINVWQGWQLSHQTESESSGHLSVGLLSLFALWTGLLGLIVTSRLSAKTSERAKALAPSLGAFILSVLSLISGTISHAGTFPLLHGILGISLFLTSMVSIFHWLNAIR